MRWLKKKEVDVFRDAMKPNKYSRLVEYEEGGIALSLLTFRYHQMNECAVRIWRLLEDRGFPKEVLRALECDFPYIPKEELLRDLQEVCLYLVQNKLWKIVRTI